MRIVSLFLVIVPLLLAACKEKPPTTGESSPGPRPYTLKTCLVSREELGSMGDPIVIVHEGQQIKFCCDSCLPKFEKDPAKYLAKLHGGGGPPHPGGMSGHKH